MTSSDVRRFEALVIPNEALERGGVEVLRAAIVDGDLHVTLRRTFEQPDHWGGLLSEVTRRIARTYAVDGEMREQDVFVRIRTAYAGDVTPGTKKKASKKVARKAAKKPIKKSARRRKKR